MVELMLSRLMWHSMNNAFWIALNLDFRIFFQICYVWNRAEHTESKLVCHCTRTEGIAVPIYSSKRSLYLIINTYWSRSALILTHVILHKDGTIQNLIAILKRDGIVYINVWMKKPAQLLFFRIFMHLFVVFLLLYVHVFCIANSFWTELWWSVSYCLFVLYCSVMDKSSIFPE